MKDVSDENSSSDEETEMSETLMEGEGNFQNLKWKKWRFNWKRWIWKCISRIKSNYW